MPDLLRTAVAAAALTATLLLAAPASATSTPEPSDGSADEATVTPQDLVSFGISPAGVDRPDNRPYLSMAVPTGAVVYEHAALINQDDAPVSLDVYGTDVIMADGGGLSARAAAEVSSDAGSWISIVGPTTLEVPAQTPDTGFGYVVVPFTVTIPADAEPGDHIGGVVASLVGVGAGGENAPSIQLEQRVVARVYIRVQGELDPRLEVSDVVATWLPGAAFGAGSMSVDYTLRNTGNVRMAVEPQVEVTGPFGLLSSSADGARVDELMPGGETRITTVVQDVWPLLRETVTVHATAVAGTGGEDPGVGTVSAAVQTWALPWVILGVLLLVLAALVRRVLRARRRQARRNQAPQGGRRSRRGSGRSDAPAPVGVGSAVEAEPPVHASPVGARAARH
ncbi:hypothetical protein [Cellulomonas sp. KRMCY2]|uniref:hypothetical protein n=1 Tax=Cellulomonas sp. KRMCY2 TaxID=1304865 RepID=UPI00045E713F|nr:hypothetical protein [Cellulomonas sp. KRMCY2]